MSAVEIYSVSIELALPDKRRLTEEELNALVLDIQNKLNVEILIKDGKLHCRPSEARPICRYIAKTIYVMTELIYRESEET